MPQKTAWVHGFDDCNLEQSWKVIRRLNVINYPHDVVTKLANDYINCKCSLSSSKLPHESWVWSGRWCILFSGLHCSSRLIFSMQVAFFFKKEWLVIYRENNLLQSKWQQINLKRQCLTIQKKIPPEIMLPWFSRSVTIMMQYSIFTLHLKDPAAFTNHLILRCTNSENMGMKYINLQLRI